jgi:hypothetical protein
MSFIFQRPLRALALAGALGLASSACTSQLDQVPSYTANAEVVYRDPVQIQQSLVRLYATLAVSGQSGPDGQPDISGIGEDFSQYLRQYWSMQEIASDEGIMTWNDGNLSDISRNTWNANNEFIRAIYDRIFYQIGLCNEFIRQTSDDNLASRGITDSNTATTIRQYRAEARFLRALSYWHALDMFGNVPFSDETLTLGGTPPPQTTRAALFAYIEGELKAIEPTLVPARTSYARADQGACQTLLTKLYLNAEVYTGTARNTDAVTYANKVLAANYTLAPEYRLLFLADNDATAANREVIFTIPFDGNRTRTFGGMPFILHASLGGSVPAADFGVNGGWTGMRIKPNIVDLFPGFPGATTDARASFYTAGQTRTISDLFTFSQGYLVTKYKNVTSTGRSGSSAQANGGDGNFVDIDYPMFRLADVKLMYAEALLRGGTGGTAGTALDQVNDVRRRSGATPLTSVQLSNILDERGRELYWEAHRRTDLIRFGRFTTGNNWPQKGGLATGRDIAAFRTLFPIPATDLAANPNLKQNPGY